MTADPKGFQVKTRDDEGKTHDERWTADVTALPYILADLRDDPQVAEAWIVNAADGTPFDPEMLPPVEKIRYAEQLIRCEHRVLGDGWMFWGPVADHLNDIAHVPEMTSHRSRDWRDFNRAQTMATGYIRMSAAARPTVGERDV